MHVVGAGGGARWSGAAVEWRYDEGEEVNVKVQENMSSENMSSFWKNRRIHMSIRVLHMCSQRSTYVRLRDVHAQSAFVIGSHGLRIRSLSKRETA